MKIITLEEHQFNKYAENHKYRSYYQSSAYGKIMRYCDEKGNINPAKLDQLMPWAEELPEECRKPRRS